MDVELVEAIVSVVVAIGGLLAAVITYVIIPLIRANTTQKQRQTGYGIVEAAVGYVEQEAKNRGWNSTKKKQEALEWAESQLNDIGLTVSKTTLEGWIESAVNNLGASLEELMALDEAEAELRE